MTYHYLTRFQLKKIQEEYQCDAKEAATHFQLKKIQEKQQHDEEVEEIEELMITLAILNIIDHLLPMSFEKVKDVAMLFQHFYDSPLLFKKWDDLPRILWNVINDIENLFLKKLNTLPVICKKNDKYSVMNKEELEYEALRAMIFKALHVMELVRIKYL